MICGARRIPLSELYAAGTRERHRFEARRKAYLSPALGRLQRARGSRRREPRDGRDPHPAQRARGGYRAADQSDAVPRANRWRDRHGLRLGIDREHGAWCRWRDGEPSLRNYRIPAFADVPPSEVFFADTYDRIGPLGAKSQGECAINPVAPAIANAVANATGIRFAHLPLTPDRIFAALSSQP